MDDARTDGHKQFFPEVLEEIFIVNANTVLNYVAFVKFSGVSLINMLDGPIAGGHGNDVDDEDEGYRSQEVFTQEKYAYLFFKAQLMLEFLYDRGVYQGHLNALNLRLADNY